MGAPPISTGSGIGSPGSPQSPTQREVETSAWSEVNKAMLNITQDSIELSFTQLDPRYSHSHLGTHTGYRARENQPMLDHYIDTERSLLSPNALLNETSVAIYEELVNKLAPPEFKTRFLAEMGKPLDERSSDFTAVDNMLKAASQALVGLQSASQAAAPEGLEAARTALNFLTPLTAFQSAIHVGNDVLDAAGSYMRHVGPNDRYYDQHSDTLNQLRDILDDFKTVDLPALAQHPDLGAAG